MLSFEIEIDPNAPAVIRDLERSADEVTEEIIRFVAEEAPGEMQRIMLESTPSGRSARGGGQRSAPGEPPAIESRELLTSIQGRVLDRSTAEISMASHAQYLDPVFGGYLNRPFIERGIEKALEKL